MKTFVHLCDFRSEPDLNAECLEVIWSEGRACKKCNKTCYRSGWSKSLVDADNRTLVKLNGQPEAIKNYISKMKKQCWLRKENF